MPARSAGAAGGIRDRGAPHQVHAVRSGHVPARQVLTYTSYARCAGECRRQPRRRPAAQDAPGTGGRSDGAVRDQGVRGHHRRRDRGRGRRRPPYLLPPLPLQGGGDLPGPRRHPGPCRGGAQRRSGARAPARHGVPWHQGSHADVRGAAGDLGGPLPAHPRGAHPARGRDRLGGPLRAAVHPLSARPLRRARARRRRQRRPAAGRGRRLRGRHRPQPCAAALAAGGRPGRCGGTAGPRLRDRPPDLRHRHRRGAGHDRPAGRERPGGRLGARRGARHRRPHRRPAGRGHAHHRGGAEGALSTLPRCDDGHPSGWPFWHVRARFPADYQGRSIDHRSFVT
ncbi:hypothetical protein SGPA1_10526 [Streptomyces misionensis JCM 4497]